MDDIISKLDSVQIDDVKKHKCGICSKIFANNRNLKRHIFGVHKIGKGNMYKCDFDNCMYETSLPYNLKTHKVFVHNMNETIYLCDLCNTEFKTVSCINRHKKLTHGIDLILIKCSENNCNSEFKTNQAVTKHLMTIHGINLKWLDCDIIDCCKKFKTKSDLIFHKSITHELNVIWKYCVFDNCTFTTKQKSHLKTHIQNVHDIGNNKCDLCKEDKYSSINYIFNGNDLNICKKCYKISTGVIYRVEFVLSKYLDKIEPLVKYLAGSDKSLKSMGGCDLIRPDKIYILPNLILWIECDEFQHLHGNNNYICDEARISKGFDNCNGTNLVVIRWNPDQYIPMAGEPLSLEERLDGLKDIILEVIETPPNELIYIYYMYYNEDNILLPENLPYEIVH